MRVMSRAWLWVLAASVVISVAPGRMALTDPDEARYAEASREMLREGDLVVPRFNDEPRLNKPPLIHWMQAASFLALDESETAARLPSLLAALAILALTARCGNRRLGPDAGGPAAAALAVTLLFFACARLAITDMLLALWITLALMSWHEAVSATDGAVRRRRSWIAAAAIGLAVMTKGPVGPALAGAIILATAACTGARRMITLRGAGLAMAWVALVAGPWMACLAARIGMAGIVDLLRREALERSTWGLDHPRPLYYFLATWWATFFPWSLAAPFILFRTLRPPRTRDPVSIFLLCWLLGTLVFFSLLTDKNDAYLLPAAPALALLAARWLPRRLNLGISSVMAMLLIAAVLIASAPLSRDRSLKELALSANLRSDGDRILISYRLYRPSLVFYANHPARWVASGAELRRMMSAIPESAAVTIVMTEARLENLRLDTGLDLGRFRIAGTQEGYVALSRSSLRP